jgi:hypothetical protein
MRNLHVRLIVFSRFVLLATCNIVLFNSQLTCLVDVGVDRKLHLTN